MDLIVEARAGEMTGSARLGDRVFHCALGRAGIHCGKREGDGATPSGKFALRQLYYRADRVGNPATALPACAIAPTDGWCDDQADKAYNCLVTLPYEARHEEMWRQDNLYDLVVVIGHNDAPVMPGFGSAVFLHVARDDFGPTDGCVAFSRNDLEAILRELGPRNFVDIRLLRG